MSVKLSELLEHAAAVLCSVDVTFPTSGMPIPVNIYRQRAERLRAIAPALVEAVVEVCERHRNEDGESLHLLNGCAVCALALTLEEAGVTCE